MEIRSWIKEFNILHYHMEGLGVMIGERNVERVSQRQEGLKVSWSRLQRGKREPSLV